MWTVQQTLGFHGQTNLSPSTPQTANSSKNQGKAEKSIS